MIKIWFNARAFNISFFFQFYPTQFIFFKLTSYICSVDFLFQINLSSDSIHKFSGTYLDNLYLYQAGFHQYSADILLFSIFNYFISILNNLVLSYIISLFFIHILVLTKISLTYSYIAIVNPQKYFNLLSSYPWNNVVRVKNSQRKK